MAEGGWSKKYTVNVTFLPGHESNEATKSYRYSSISIYAVIFLSKEQARENVILGIQSFKLSD